MSRVTFPRLAPGSLFESRFKIVRHLGDGGMGTVYEVVQIYLDRPMALKLVPLTARAKDVDLRSQFALEMRTLAALDHPTIVKIWDGGVTNDHVAYIAMSLLEGRTLRQLLYHGLLDDYRASLVLAQVAEGLRVLHAVPILHRDIKPENIFVGAGADTKLIDFGLARVRTASKYATRNPNAVGTLHYMPYEQLMNEPLDESVDVYALGLVAWECFAGAHPLASTSGTFPDRQTAMTHVAARRPIPHLSTVRPDLPQDLGDLLLRCTSIEPSERPKPGEIVRLFEGLARDFKRKHEAHAPTEELARTEELPATVPQPRAAPPPIQDVPLPAIDLPTQTEPQSRPPVHPEPVHPEPVHPEPVAPRVHVDSETSGARVFRTSYLAGYEPSGIIEAAPHPSPPYQALQYGSHPPAAPQNAERARPPTSLSPAPPPIAPPPIVATPPTFAQLAPRPPAAQWPAAPPPTFQTSRWPARVRLLIAGAIAALVFLGGMALLEHLVPGTVPLLRSEPQASEAPASTPKPKAAP